MCSAWSHGMATPQPHLKRAHTATLTTACALPRSVWLQKDDGSRMQAKVLGAMPGGLLYNVMAGGMVQKVGAAVLAPMVPGEGDHTAAWLLCWCALALCAALLQFECAAALLIATPAQHVGSFAAFTVMTGCRGIQVQQLEAAQQSAAKPHTGPSLMPLLLPCLQPRTGWLRWAACQRLLLPPSPLRGRRKSRSRRRRQHHLPRLHPPPPLLSRLLPPLLAPSL